MFKLVTKEGFLKKRGNNRKNWKKRWFKLHDCKLSYYDNKTKKKQKGFVYLEDCDIQVVSVHRNLFQIGVRDKRRKYLIHAYSKTEMYEWIGSIFLHRDQIYFGRQ
ncbi:sesquipedalian [Anaeramoeba flamelloides]|uniref:Sesquipedalian n=1 Tax=Anaeramoeba flamelloides TaxID=1746091 RepID=A0ABQ8YJQ1_9EUKA|nr:sesquipedalian [Anaeramoeba flamelloides]